jgi:hypothetical protein
LTDCRAGPGVQEHHKVQPCSWPWVQSEARATPSAATGCSHHGGARKALVAAWRLVQPPGSAVASVAASIATSVATRQAIVAHLHAPREPIAGPARPPLLLSPLTRSDQPGRPAVRRAAAAWRASRRRRNARKPPPPQGRRGPRERARPRRPAGLAHRPSACLQLPQCPLAIVGWAEWTAPPAGPERRAAPPSCPDLTRTCTRRGFRPLPSGPGRVATLPGVALAPGCFDSDPIHRRFWSETAPVSPEPLYASYGALY